jgi:regulator of protease activity HflC (stomatin/prohibitin superfamily)
MDTASGVLLATGIVLVCLVFASLRLVQQYQRGIVFRFGRVLENVRPPGLRVIIPIADRMVKVSLQTVVMGVPAQGAITRDNVTLTVDAVVYYRVVDPIKALVNVRDYPRAVLQVAQTSLRSVIGRADLDTLLSDRERINAELKAAIDAPTEKPWGVLIERVEVKDVALPDSMKRSMSRQAEAERERRARIIAADGEFQASRRLADAARAMRFFDRATKSSLAEAGARRPAAGRRCAASGPWNRRVTEAARTREPRPPPDRGPGRWHSPRCRRGCAAARRHCSGGWPPVGSRRGRWR